MGRFGCSFVLILALAVGNFVIGMGAFVVIGLLTPIADGFGISTGYAAMAFAVYTATYAVMSPLLISASGNIGRRNVLVAAMAVFMAGSLLSALAPTPVLLFCARAVAALGGSVFTPVAASVAFSAVPPERRGRALALVFLGMTSAQALGVPAGTYIGFAYGWQTTFILLAFMALGTILLLATQVPERAAFQINSLGMLLRTLQDWRLLVGVLVTATHLGAMSILYAFISPVTAELAGMGSEGATLVLLVFGISATVSSLFVGYLVDRIPAAWTVAAMIVLHALIMPAFSFLPLPPFAVILLTALWAMTTPAFMVAQQALLIARAPAGQTIMLSLNATSNYAGSTIGAAIGAAVVLNLGMVWLGWFAAGFSLVALGNFLAGMRLVPLQQHGSGQGSVD